MTTNSLRIYVYKITFYEVPHYYYGVHKEKKFDEYYMGSPKTHKDFWEKYTPRKEYIEFFEYSDEGYIEARKFEDSLIAPVLNDEFCLNEHVGGFCSLEVCRKAGRIGGQIGGQIGGKIGGKITYERGIGVHGRSKEKMIEDGRKGGKIIGNKHKENKTGIFGLSPEKVSENSRKGGRKGGKTTYERGIGVHAQSKEQLAENIKKINSQNWKCTETGYISTAGGLTHYQKAKGIDTSNRIKVDGPRGWKITFEGGRGIVITQNLKEWAKENGYSYDCLLKVRGGKIKNHRSIIKVVPL